MIAAATRLSVYFGDSIDSGPQPAGDALVRCFAEHRLPAVTLVRGIEGFELHRRIHSERLPDLSTDLPLLATAIGEPAAIRLALEDVDGLVPHGLLTTEATLGSILEALIATIEAIDVLKHDGRALTPPPAPGGGLAAWRAVSVYTRRTAQVDGRPLYSELTRRLREQGAACATTVLGDWGFSSDEHPHGDRLGRVASHLPTLTVTVDESERLARVWSAIDSATARHGVVTSSAVAGHREWS